MMRTFSQFRKILLRLSSFLQYPSLILALTALLASTLPIRPAWALPAGLDALPPDIQALYDAGRYRQAAEALQAAAELPGEISEDFAGQ
jgi:hypothetical protein